MNRPPANDRTVWLHLLQSQEPIDAICVAEPLGMAAHEASEALQRLVAGGFARRHDPASGQCRETFDVNGCCLIPAGVTVGEAQA